MGISLRMSSTFDQVKLRLDTKAKLEMFSGAKKSFVPPPPVVGLQAVLS